MSNRNTAPIPLTAALIDRFWSKVDRSGEGCWLWQAAKDQRGYGCMGIGTRVFRSNRIAYTATHGAIPVGMFVCHACDTPACCNPAHLWLGTNEENLADMVRKGRYRPWGAIAPELRTHCHRGHLLVGDNVRTTGTHRRCRTCVRENQASRRTKLRAADAQVTGTAA